jgi:hypothetical protein
MSKRKEELIFDSDGAVDVEAMREGRSQPTEYTAPSKDQKWRSRNVISFHFRHFNYKCPSSYRDVLLCMIDHANPKTGRCDVGQRRIARECNLRRETVNRAILWWEENTFFLRIEARPGRTNAYHVEWDNIELDWHGIQERIQQAEADEGVTTHVTPTPVPGKGGVTTDITPGVTTEVTGGVTTDITQTLKSNRKEEPHPERVHPPSAADTYVREEKEKGFSESDSVISFPANLSEAAARDRVSRHINSDQFVKANLPSTEAIEAAVAAEMRDVGSGRQIIQTAANQTWKARRSV